MRAFWCVLGAFWIIFGSNRSLTRAQYFSGRFWGCSGVVLGVFWGCSGGVLGLRRSCNIQRRRQGYPGQFLELDPMKATPTPRKQRAVPAVSAVAAPAPEVAAVILTLLCCPLLFPGSSLVLPWLFPCPSSALSWLFPGSLGRPWLFFGSSLAPRCSQMLQMLPDAPRCSQILPDTPR